MKDLKAFLEEVEKNEALSERVSSAKDVTEIAKKNKLNAKSGQKAFKKVLESLGAEECKM